MLPHFPQPAPGNRAWRRTAGVWPTYGTFGGPSGTAGSGGRGGWRQPARHGGQQRARPGWGPGGGLAGAGRV